MYPRWQTDSQTAPQRTTTLSVPKPPASRIEFGPAPILDLESQLNAELDGASWAVAAFAPQDALWADWLYRNLNGYPVPPSMVGSATAHGLPRPDCVSLFPDRRDPQHAAHYAQALEKSGYLVVVCSPHSAHCAEVDAQICAFKSAGGEERIIALVVEGSPEGALEIAPKTPEPAWLPAWLRWRFADDAFGVADSGEPRIVDARPGRASLKEVRDILLAALLDVDAWELEVVGHLVRPVEVVRAAPKPSVIAPVVAVPVRPIARPRKSGSAILTAAICASVTLGTAWWSFGRIETDRTRTMAASVQVVAAKHARPVTVRAIEPQMPAEDFVPAPAQPATPPVVAVPAPAPAPRAAQVAVLPVSAIQPVAPAVATAVAPPAPVEESATRIAIIALHQRGDAAVSQRRPDDALGFYEEAVDNARASAPNASPEAKAEAAVLCRKLGTLQLQMASTAEARASFVQGRKLLLQLKAHGQLNAERAKVLAEIDLSLRRLPRD